MSSTIESAHNKITKKLSEAKCSLDQLKIYLLEVKGLLKMLMLNIPNTQGNVTPQNTIHHKTQYTKLQNALDNIHLNLLYDELDEIDTRYTLGVAIDIAQYYNTTNDPAVVESYYNTIVSDNFNGCIDDVCDKIKHEIGIILDVIHSHITDINTSRGYEHKLEKLMQKISTIQKISISYVSNVSQYELCECGSKMQVQPETSELLCVDPTCGRIKTIIGAVFRDDQFYTQEGQKTKHGGYDELRHFNFWMERLQARETKSFSSETIDKIKYVMARDKISPSDLDNCEIMRSILHDPYVLATNLNEHISLLIVNLDGRGPPQFDFNDTEQFRNRFMRAIKLYNVVNPNGQNKPYYPYFIYKIAEFQFAGRNEQMRILNYIHLQSKDTVIKNDLLWKKMCDETVDTDDVWVYVPTDTVRDFKRWQ